MSLVAHGRVDLDGFDLELGLDVTEGEVVGLVGPNGAGKSATLRTLLGLHRLAEGRIEVAGVTVDDGQRVISPHRRGLAWVPQTPALLPRRSALRQVTAFACETPLLGSPADLLRRLDLDPADRRRPRTLSGGQAQRVAVARALATSPTVLLDEPTSAQDAANAERIRTAMRDHATAGGTVIVVAHRPEDAYAVADRLVVVEAGRVRQRGTPVELANAPASPYVARVVGATVLEGTVDADHQLSGPWGRLVVPDATAPGPAIAVIRPSSVVLHTVAPGESSARNTVAGTVRSIHDTPDGHVVGLASSPPLVAAVTHAAVAALGLTIGARVWASVKASEVEVHRR